MRLCFHCFPWLALGKIKLEWKKERLVSNHMGSLDTPALLHDNCYSVLKMTFVVVRTIVRIFLSKTNLEGQVDFKDYAYWHSFVDLPSKPQLDESAALPQADNEGWAGKAGAQKGKGSGKVGGQEGRGGSKEKMSSVTAGCDGRRVFA